MCLKRNVIKRITKKDKSSILQFDWYPYIRCLWNTLVYPEQISQYECVQRQDPQREECVSVCRCVLVHTVQIRSDSLQTETPHTLLRLDSLTSSAVIRSQTPPTARGYPEALERSWPSSQRSDPEMGPDPDEPCSDPEPQELRRHRQQLLLLWCSHSGGIITTLHSKKKGAI